MKKISNFLSNNNFVQDPESSCLTVSLNDFLNSDLKRKLADVSYIDVLIKYPQWEKNSDFFKFINEDTLEKLRNNKRFFLFFDCTTEGYSPLLEAPYFDVLYFNCKKYNISPKKIFYVSSNLKDIKNINEYNKKYHKIDSINVFCFPAFELATKDIVVRMLREMKFDAYLQTVISKVTENFTGEKYFSSLSRVNRSYRSLAQYLLSQSDASKYAIISHNIIKENSDYIADCWKRQFKILKDEPKETIKTWLKSLPIIADTRDFETNHALNKNSHLHNQTLFQIVNETQVDNLSNTTMFYSEKTFKPIAHLQPFLIYGQQGCNRALEEIGYKLYDDWFDYSFDEEPDNEFRYVKLLKETESVVTHLKNLSKHDQIKWRFKNLEILEHNYKVLENNEYTKKIINQIGEKISSHIN